MPQVQPKKGKKKKKITLFLKQELPVFQGTSPAGGYALSTSSLSRYLRFKTPVGQPIRGSRRIWLGKPEPCTPASASGSLKTLSPQASISVSVNGSRVGLRELPVPPDWKKSFSDLALTSHPLQAPAHRVHTALTGHLHREL